MKTLLLLLLFASPLSAQTSSDSLILKPIRQLFDGFRANDSALVASTFYNRSPYLGSSFNTKDGSTIFSPDKNGLQGMLKAVGTPKADSVQWDERLTQIYIEKDGGLAMVRTNYEFYVGTERKHCGVNFFTVVQTANGWKIFGVTDTRRTDCP
jgi:hypothetical protein